MVGHLPSVCDASKNIKQTTKHKQTKTYKLIKVKKKKRLTETSEIQRINKEGLKTYIQKNWKILKKWIMF
jgi:hypothetical protein